MDYTSLEKDLADFLNSLKLKFKVFYCLYKQNKYVLYPNQNINGVELFNIVQKWVDSIQWDIDTDYNLQYDYVTLGY